MGVTRHITRRVTRCVTRVTRSLSFAWPLHKPNNTDVTTKLSKNSEYK